MRDVETTPRASDPSSVLRARVGEILRAWEAAEPEGAARQSVRTFLGDCLEHVAATLDGTERTPECDALHPEDLTCAARGILIVREHALMRLERDGKPLLPEQRAAGCVLDRALRAVLDRISEERERLARCAAEAFDAERLQREAVELRERMLSIVSHDLRSPLAAIDLGGAVLLELPSTRGDPFVQKQIGVIRRNVDRMSRLIRDLLDMSSIHAGRLTLEQEHCGLSGLLADSLGAYEEAAREKNITLRTELRLEGDPIACCDRERMTHVLTHLLGNAIKFCDPGAEVKVVAEVVGREARVIISDTGSGIPEHDLPHVFDLFWKSESHRGSGLGLYVARGIVEAHGGRIGAERNEPRGSKFWFTLPLLETPQERLAEP